MDGHYAASVFVPIVAIGVIDLILLVALVRLYGYVFPGQQAAPSRFVPRRVDEPAVGTSLPHALRRLMPRSDIARIVGIVLVARDNCVGSMRVAGLLQTLIPGAKVTWLVFGSERPPFVAPERLVLCPSTTRGRLPGWRSPLGLYVMSDGTIQRCSFVPDRERLLQFMVGLGPSVWDGTRLTQVMQGDWGRGV
jgi:hypothetical protein